MRPAIATSAPPEPAITADRAGAPGLAPRRPRQRPSAGPFSKPAAGTGPKPRVRGSTGRRCGANRPALPGGQARGALRVGCVCVCAPSCPARVPAGTRAWKPAPRTGLPARDRWAPGVITEPAEFRDCTVTLAAAGAITVTRGRERARRAGRAATGRGAAGGAALGPLGRRLRCLKATGWAGHEGTAQPG